MFNPTFEEDPYFETGTLAMQAGNAGMAVAFGTAWAMYWAGVRDARKLNPLFDVYCEFWAPVLVVLETETRGFPSTYLGKARLELVA